MRNSNHTTLAAVLIVLALFANYSIYSKIITDKLPKAEYTEPQNTELTAAQKAELEKNSVKRIYLIIIRILPRPKTTQSAASLFL